MASSTLYSEKSGSKKSGPGMKGADAKSVQSPLAQSEKHGDTEKSKTASER
jgi:hypothetical protein